MSTYMRYCPNLRISLVYNNEGNQPNLQITIKMVKMVSTIKAT